MKIKFLPLVLNLVGCSLLFAEETSSVNFVPHMVMEPSKVEALENGIKEVGEHIMGYDSSSAVGGRIESSSTQQNIGSISSEILESPKGNNYGNSKEATDSVSALHHKSLENTGFSLKGESSENSCHNSVNSTSVTTTMDTNKISFPLTPTSTPSTSTLSPNSSPDSITSEESVSHGQLDNKSVDIDSIDTRRFPGIHAKLIANEVAQRAVDEGTLPKKLFSLFSEDKSKIENDLRHQITEVHHFNKSFSLEATVQSIRTTAPEEIFKKVEEIVKTIPNLPEFELTKATLWAAAYPQLAVRAEKALATAKSFSPESPEALETIKTALTTTAEAVDASTKALPRPIYGASRSKRDFYIFKVAEHAVENINGMKQVLDIDTDQLVSTCSPEEKDVFSGILGTNLQMKRVERLINNYDAEGLAQDAVHEENGYKASLASRQVVKTAKERVDNAFTIKKSLHSSLFEKIPFIIKSSEEAAIIERLKNPITACIDAIQESLEIIEEALPAAQILMDQVVSKEVSIDFN